MDAPEQSIARAVRPVITPFALVAIPVRESVDAAAVPLVVPPFALIACPARPRVDALAVLHPLPPLPLVAIAVGESVDTRAVLVPVVVLALVALPVGGGVEALAVPLSPEHLSHVLREYAVVEPLHGPAAGGAAVWATVSAPCYNVPRCVPGVPHPAAGAGVD